MLMVLTMIVSILIVAFTFANVVMAIKWMSNRDMRYARVLAKRHGFFFVFGVAESGMDIIYNNAWDIPLSEFGMIDKAAWCVNNEHAYSLVSPDKFHSYSSSKRRSAYIQLMKLCIGKAIYAGVATLFGLDSPEEKVYTIGTAKKRNLNQIYK